MLSQCPVFGQIFQAHNHAFLRLSARFKLALNIMKHAPNVMNGTYVPRAYTQVPKASFHTCNACLDRTFQKHDVDKNMHKQYRLFVHIHAPAQNARRLAWLIRS